MNRRMRTATATLLLCIMVISLFAGCAGSAGETILSVEGEKARRDDFMMHLFFTKYEYFYSYINDASTGMKFSDLYALTPDVLGTEFAEGLTVADYFKIAAASALVQVLVNRKLLKENNLSLTAAEKAALDDSKAEFIQGMGGAAPYNAFLKAIRSTDRAYEQYLRDSYGIQKVYALFADGGPYALSSEEKVASVSEYGEKYITARHILLFTIDQVTRTSIDDAGKAAQKAKANEALKKLRAGESFDEIQKEYSEDTMLAGMTFTTGQMTAAFETAAFALQIGDYSDVVETEYGFHIILRTELSDDMYSTYYNSLIFEKYNAFMEPLVEDAEVKYSSAYSNLIIQ